MMVRRCYQHRPNHHHHHAPADQHRGLTDGNALRAGKTTISNDGATIMSKLDIGAAPTGAGRGVVRPRVVVTAVAWLSQYTRPPARSWTSRSRRTRRCAAALLTTGHSLESRSSLHMFALVSGRCHAAAAAATTTTATPCR
jgi:hypothetical protein